MDKERFEEIKQDFQWGIKVAGKGQGYTNLHDDDVSWLISTVEEQARRLDNMAHVIKLKNKEMRELSNFLKEKNIPLKELSPLITVMAHVERLEKENKWLDGGWGAAIKMREERDKRIEGLLEENQRYREVIERLYKFDGNIQEHSALADMLCGEILEGEE
ncbi:hypothetical protein K0H71_15090 [Bacillus sp. IITD106]|nr:hypothetical protein [Bacillus sp. IITD106]